MIIGTWKCKEQKGAEMSIIFEYLTKIKILFTDDS